MKADRVVSAIIALIVGSVNTIAFFVFLCDILCGSRRRLKRLPVLVHASPDGRPWRAAAGALVWDTYLYSQACVSQQQHANSIQKH